MGWIVGNGRANQQPGRAGAFQRAIHHLLNRVGDDRLAAFMAVGNPHPREQQPQKVVNVAGRAHRRAGVGRAGALGHRDGRAEAQQGVQVGLFQLSQELPRRRGQGFHVTAVPFGIEGVEGQRGFSRAGRPRDHHQLVLGDGNVDVLQVVLAGALDFDPVRHLRLLLHSLVVI